MPSVKWSRSTPLCSSSRQVSTQSLTVLPIASQSQPHSNGKVLAHTHSLLDRSDDLPMELNTFFHSLRAILIGSTVDQRGEKLIEEIAVGEVKFNSLSALQKYELIPHDNG